MQFATESGIPPSRLYRFCVVDKVNGLLLAGDYGDFLVPCAVGLVPGSQRILAWWEFRQSELAIFSCYREIASIKDGEISSHPGVQVTFYWYELRLTE